MKNVAQNTFFLGHIVHVDIILQVIPAVNFQVTFNENKMLLVSILVDLIKYQNNIIFLWNFT